jgi:hypothetical protein
MDEKAVVVDITHQFLGCSWRIIDCLSCIVSQLCEVLDCIFLFSTIINNSYKNNIILTSCLLMKSMLLLAIASLCTAAPLAARVAPVDTIYYNATADRLPSRIGAVRGIVTTPTPTGGIIQNIYTIEGHHLEQIPYSDKEGKVREGMATSWYVGGEMKGRRMYRNGLLDGPVQVFYPDGTLRQLDQYSKGVSKSRLCFEPNGKPTECAAEDNSATRVYAHYRRGDVILQEEVNRAVRRLPLPTGSPGVRVIVACMVGIDGQIHETRMFKSGGPEFDREALRVINSLRADWTPELQDKEPVESFYMINVDFKPEH